MDPDAARLCLAHVLEKFPADAVLIDRLAGEDEMFLSICEDYALARVTRRRFEQLGADDHSSEIAEYRSLENELGREIESALCEARKRIDQ